MTAAARSATRLIRREDVAVNGVVISRAAIAGEAQHHRAPTPDAAWILAARALAIRELLAQEAGRLEVTAEPLEDGEGRRETDEEAKFRALLEREVRTPRADEASCRRYYEQNLRRFRSPDLFEAAHILLPAAPQDAAGREAARGTAQALIAELRQDPAGFAAAAEAHSACPSARLGGVLGQVGPEQLVPEFEAALRGMEAGVVHPEPVESRYGIHVVRLDRRIDGDQLPFELVRSRIADYLEETVRRRALRQYVSVLAGRAKIAGVDLSDAQGPLVQ